MTRACLSPALALWLVLLWPGPTRPQAVEPPPQEPAPPTFRAGVDLVRLDVRVTDTGGRPIEDLRREELQVVEDGHVRPILFFQHVAEPEGTFEEVARRTVASEVSTNRGAPRGHLYVLVFDQHHITAGNEQRARQAAERFLAEHVRPGDRVALYALPGPGPQISFTGDRRRLAEALLQVRGSLERVGIGALGTMTTYEAYQITRGNQLVLARVADRLASDTVSTDTPRTGTRGARAGIADPGIFYRLVGEDARTMVARADEEVRRFLVVLTDLMRGMRAIEGRKTVVVLSEGFYTDGVSRELEQAAAAAAESYSVIYALDLNRRGDFAAASGPLGGEHQADIENRLEPLATLALETDGVLVTDAASRLDQAFDRLAAESRDYYIVGFEPSPEALKRPDQYHRMNVSVRRAGARVSTRTGYSVAGTRLTPADRRRAIDLALAAPFPQQALPIEYTTYVLRGAADGLQRVVLSLAVDLPVASGPATRGADVIFVVRRASDGRVVASGSDVIPLPPAPSEGSTTGRGAYRVQFEVPSGLHLMRVVVREPGGLVGSADRHFEVRPLTTRDLTASDLIFGTDADGLPVRPAVESGGTLEGIVELYARSATDLEAVDVTVDLFRLGDASAVTSVRADLLDLEETGGGVSRVARVNLPLEAIDPGQYVARATVRARQEDVTELIREIEVLLPSAAPVARATSRTAPDPLALLQGEVTRRSLENIRDRGPVELRPAATLALAGDWMRVEAALPAAADEAGVEPAFRLAEKASAEPAFGLAARGILRGLARFARREFDASAVALEAAVALQPDDAAAAFLLGWAYAGMGDNRRAIGAWRNAARLDPTLVPAHLALADTFVRMAEPALALQAVQNGLSALPRSPELLDRLARLRQ